MSEKTRKRILFVGTGFMILLGLLLVFGWFVFLFDAIKNRSLENFRPLIIIPLALIWGAGKVRKIWGVV